MSIISKLLITPKLMLIQQKKVLKKVLLQA
jgi:hypothetical protein